MSQRTNASLYDTNTIHHEPAWNVPLPPKYTERQRVKTQAGEVGIVSFVLPTPATSSMRARENAYGVRFGSNDPVILMESSISPA